MKATYLALTVLCAGCIDTSQDVYIPENTTLTASAALLTEQVARIQFASMLTYQSKDKDGVNHHKLWLRASVSPFVCSNDIQDYDNRFDISIDSLQEPAVGDILPIESLEAALLSEDYLTYFHANVYQAPNPDLEGSLEITAIDGDSLSGIVTARISGERMYISGEDDAPEEVTFTMNLNEIPDCNSLSFY